MNFFIKILYNSLGNYPTPLNLNYWWNFGVYALICMIIQLISGIFLAMYYICDTALAFDSVEYIMREVNFGWLIRYIHANGASLFFAVIYIHMFRGIYYGSFMGYRRYIWLSGVAILMIMIVTAFLGYVLPWGQMSFRAATVITNSISAIPFIGTDIVIWLWGGYSVDRATLSRFFSLHYLLPFVLLGLILIHLILLHEQNSSNPLGIEYKYSDYLMMYPYYIYKDTFGLIIFFMIYSSFVFFMPNYLGHPDNYIPANPMVTPIHIVPEWYFLPFYAILRSIPDKLLGVITMLCSLLILCIAPYLREWNVANMGFKPLSRIFFWLFVANRLLLGWIGSCPAEYPYVDIGRYLTVYYFIHWLFIFPGIEKFEDLLYSAKYY